MKKLILIVFMFFLTSCAIIDVYRMAKFDNNEYALINSVRTQANLGAAKCGTPEVKDAVNKIYYKAVELKNYSQSIPKNEETIKMSSELAEIVKGLNDRYKETEPVSLPYCTTKFGLIEKNAVTIQNVVGGKPR